MEDKPFTLNTNPICKETEKIAYEELRETPEIVNEALVELKEILKQDTNLQLSFDDEFLKLFLRPCKFYAKSAYKLIKKVAEFKEKHCDLLKSLTPQDEKDAFTNYNVVNVLKKRDQKGRRVLLVNCGGTWDPSKVNTNQIFRIFYLVHLCALLEPETQVRGVVVIMDFSGMSMKQVTALNYYFSNLLLSFIQEAMPLRLKEIHIVKEPLVFKIVWKLFSRLMGEKLKKRTILHGSKMDQLHKHIDKNYLPKNYNGNDDIIDYSGNDWFPCIEGHIDFFTKWNEFGIVKKI